MTETTPVPPKVIAKKDIAITDFRLLFSHWAMSRWSYFCEKAPTEVGMMCLLADNEKSPFYVEDVRPIGQTSTSASVDYDAEALAKFHDECAVSGMKHWQHAACQAHTHPTGVKNPSGTDENNFNNFRYPFNLMLILRKGDGKSHGDELFAGLVGKIVMPLTSHFTLVQRFDFKGVIVDPETVSRDAARMAALTPSNEGIVEWNEELKVIKAPTYSNHYRGGRPYGHDDEDDYSEFSFRQLGSSSAVNSGYGSRARQTYGESARFVWDREHKCMLNCHGYNMQGQKIRHDKATPTLSLVGDDDSKDSDEKPGWTDSKVYTDSQMFQTNKARWHRLGYDADLDIDPIDEKYQVHTANLSRARVRKSRTYERYDQKYGWIPCPEALCWVGKPRIELNKQSRKMATNRDRNDCEKLYKAVQELASYEPVFFLSEAQFEHLTAGGNLRVTDDKMMSADNIELFDIAMDGTITPKKLAPKQLPAPTPTTAPVPTPQPTSTVTEPIS